MGRRRIVVSGMGAITPLGNSVSETWMALLKGSSGIGPITAFDATEHASRIAGEVRDLDSLAGLPGKEMRRLDRFAQLGMAAAIEAVADAGISVVHENPTKVGVFMGSGIGGLATIEANHKVMLEQGPRRVSPFFIPGSIVNMAAGAISMHFGFTGPNVSFATACSTGAHSIGEAAEVIRRGGADVMLAGGSEATVTPLAVAGFCASRALSTRNAEPTRASRPWDRDRDGFVLGEGAGCLVLEELTHAKNRGARIYAELVGFGMSSDAYHITSPPDDGRGAYAAMRHALEDAMVPVDLVRHINAHATSTPAGDNAEASAIARLFGEVRGSVALTSTKSMTGHLLGAAGAVEAIFTILALRESLIPATLNLEHPENEFGLNLVTGDTRECDVNFAMSNSFGFGGTNAALVFARAGRA